MCRRSRSILLIAAIMLGAAGVACATTLAEIHYRPTSLPSDQGWSYVTDGWRPESDIFALADDLLVVDSLGDGVWFFEYERDLPYDAAVTHVSATMRARVAATESGGSAPGSYALTLGFTYGPPGGAGHTAMIALSTTEVEIVSGDETLPLDTTAWHDYTLSADLTSGQCALFVDGASVAQWSSQPWPDARLVRFGDGVSPHNVHAEIGSVDVWLTDDGAVAAESRAWSAVKGLFVD